MENYELIKKTDAPFIEKGIELKPKKYIKTSDIIYINKNNLDNELNKDVYGKYLKYIKSCA